MATFRVGVGSFNIQDGAVGFGTDTDGLGNLKVKGVTKTTDIKVSGASTLTRYSGFAADNINQLENITLTSEVGTIGDIVVGVGTSVIISSGSTVTVGTVESVSIGTHFSPPTGDINEHYINRVAELDRGMIASFYKRDFNPIKALINDVKQLIKPDVILIDTNSGINDLSSITINDLSTIFEFSSFTSCL